LQARQDGKPVLKASIAGVELRFETRPGLFSPRAPDAGTVAMLSLIRFEPNDKVLDLGCGYGLVGIYAAHFMPPEQVYLLDNDPAAVEVARINNALNGVPDVNLILSDGFGDTRETGFTKIISNPPYHVDFSVPKQFIEKGFNRLTLGGSMWMVTRRLTWYKNKLKAIFGGSRIHEVNGYYVFEAIKTSSQYGGGRRSIDEISS
jgi:16S rRNA (guanine1207-N2)-methyltransferase